MIKVLDAVKTNNGHADCCRLAAMAGETIRPANVNYGKVYKTADGDFRMVSKFGKKALEVWIERVTGA